MGTKKDLRTHNDITLAELESKRVQQGLENVCETSSKEFRDDENVSKAFRMAIRMAYYNKYPDDM